MAAIAFTAVLAHAGQNDPRLARLFVALKSTQSAGWARTLEDEITHIWSQTPDAESQQLNTLKLEPRHFGALAGLGQVELALGNEEAALNAFNQALEIDPHLGDVAEMADNLKQELAGKAI